MSTRVRSISKVGKGKYVTSSYKVSEYLIANVLYFIFIYLPFLIIKYLFYYPIKWCVIKITNIIKKTKHDKSQ